MGRSDVTEIQKFIEERGVTSLLHFTKVTNVPGILAHGLLGRDTLAKCGIEAQVNDQYRYDRVSDAICASISFPNYKMFYGLQQSNPELDWAVLRISPKILWEAQCAYCARNAASNEVTCTPVEDRTGLSALKSMFEDIAPDVERASLGIPNNYTTDPQAEVLILTPVDPSYILSVNVNVKGRVKDMAAVEKLFKPYFYKFKFFHDASLFTYRKDYEHWRRSPEQHDDLDIDFNKLFDL